MFFINLLCKDIPLALAPEDKTIKYLALISESLLFFVPLIAKQRLIWFGGGNQYISFDEGRATRRAQSVLEQISLQKLSCFNQIKSLINQWILAAGLIHVKITDPEKNVSGCGFGCFRKIFFFQKKNWQSSVWRLVWNDPKGFLIYTKFRGSSSPETEKSGCRVGIINRKVFAQPESFCA